MLNFSAIRIGSSDSKKLAEFYAKVFGFESQWNQEDWYGFKVGTGNIVIGPHSEINGLNSEPARLMINIEADDVQKEFDRIKATGAKVIKEPVSMSEDAGSADISTFEDPEGNYFQIVSIWEDA